MRNVDIRTEVKEAGVKLWQVAEQLGMSDSAFSRYLRHELTELQKARIRKIIRELAEESKNMAAKGV